VRKLSHPIAVFIVVVLILIGVGVGIVSLNPLPQVFGPPGGTFTADFPSPVVVTVMCEPNCLPGVSRWTVYQATNERWLAEVAVQVGGNNRGFTPADVGWLKSTVRRFQVEGLSNLQMRVFMSDSSRITRITAHTPSLPLSGFAEILTGRGATWVMEAQGLRSRLGTFEASFRPLG